jgi:hypothetical protein
MAFGPRTEATRTRHFRLPLTVIPAKAGIHRQEAGVSIMRE